MLFILSTPFPLLAGFPSSTVFKLQTSQTIRGTIIDKQSESPLIGAAVQVVGITPVLGSVANENGSFEI
jgi:hypothetical protein